MTISQEAIEAFALAFWPVNAVSKMESCEGDIAKALEAALPFLSSPGKEGGQEEEKPCSVCGNEERGQGGYLSCECPAPRAASTALGLSDDELAREEHLQREREEENRRQLENEEMEIHFDKHPHG